MFASRGLIRVSFAHAHARLWASVFKHDVECATAVLVCLVDIKETLPGGRSTTHHPVIPLRQTQILADAAGMC